MAFDHVRENSLFLFLNHLELMWFHYRNSQEGSWNEFEHRVVLNVSDCGVQSYGNADPFCWFPA